jgi:cobalt-zinc-cadmium efflux system outer membrane protein
MSARLRVCGACAAVCLISSAAASARALTLEEAIALARERAPDVLRSQLAVADARGALAQAEVPLRDNPVLEAEGGPRYTAMGEWIPQLSVGLSQQLELADARGARIDRARAAIEGAQASSEEAQRAAAWLVAASFADALAARDLLARAEEARSVAEALATATEARAASGDASAIDVRRLRITASQARADEQSARGALARATGELRALLALPDETLELEGALDAIAIEAATPAGERPEVRALRAALREAAAERRAGDAMAVPELRLGLSYQHEEGDHMGIVAASLTLPFFDHGQGVRARADARRDALERELEVRERAIAAQIASAREASASAAAALVESVRALEDAAALDTMVQRSFAAGEISLGELLFIRAELQAAARNHVVRQRDAAVLRIALQAALSPTRNP